MSDAFESLSGLRLVDPVYLLLLLALPLALILRRLQREPALLFAPEALIERGLGPLARRHRRLLLLPRLLQMLGLAGLALALARPITRVELPRSHRGIDIVLVLDQSSSMTATDLDPAGEMRRIDVVREAADRFVAARPDDRIAIVRFARYPDLLCPLTLDHEASRRFLAELEVVAKDSPEDATAIGAAVARAARLVDGRSGRQGVVVLLTDGEENVAVRERPDEIAPFHAAQLAADRGLRVHAIAAGRDRRGVDGVMRPIDVSDLERLAEKTGGRFFRADEAGAVFGVYDEIDRLEKQALEERRFRIEDRFLVFLVCGLILLFIGRLLRSTWLEVLP